MTFEENLDRNMRKNNPLCLRGGGGGKMVCLTPTDCYCRFFVMLKKNFTKGYIEYPILLDEMTTINGVIKKDILRRLRERGFRYSWLIVSSMRNEVLREGIKPFVSTLVELLGGDFNEVAYNQGFQMYLDLYQQKD